MKCTKDEETAFIKKMLCKYTYDIDEKRCKGSFKIVGFRKYSGDFRLTVYQIDIKFDGKIQGTINGQESTWYDSSILQDKRYSKIRINKLIKSQVKRRLNTLISMFGIKYIYLDKVKVKWV